MAILKKIKAFFESLLGFEESLSPALSYRKYKLTFIRDGLIVRKIFVMLLTDAWGNRRVLVEGESFMNGYTLMDQPWWFFEVKEWYKTGRFESLLENGNWTEHAVHDTSLAEKLVKKADEYTDRFISSRTVL